MNMKSTIDLLSRPTELSKLNLQVDIASAQVTVLGLERAADSLHNRLLITALSQRIDEAERSQAENEHRIEALERARAVTSLRNSLRGEAPVPWLYFVENVELIRSAILNGEISRELALEAGGCALDAYANAQAVNR